MAEIENRSRQIDAKIINADDMVSMFRDMDRPRRSDFAFKWHSFPTTKGDLQATLAEISADGKGGSAFIVNNYDTVIYELNDRLPYISNPAGLDELNYLAVKMDSMTMLQFNIFRSVIEAGRHCESIKDVINIAENMDNFDLQPAYSAEHYGEFLIEVHKDNTSPIFDRLEQSADPDARAFAQYILRLEANVDAAAYGRAAAAEENGVFTEQGYLTENGEFQEVYRGPEDIPPECRVSVPPARGPAERPSVVDKLAAALEAVNKADSDKPNRPPKSRDAEL